MLWQGPTQTKVGDTFAVQLVMQAEQPVVSVPIAIGFDPRLLQVVDVSEGGFLRQGGAQTSFSYRVDPGGQVVMTATSSGNAGATAPDAIVTMNFRALAAGATLPVLGADTVVVCDGQVLEKPRDAEHAQAMLLRLANRRHQVMTGVALVDRARIEQQVVVTQVAFGPITPQQAAAYWHTGEPADKAGGYAIQGLAAVFVERIEGSFSNVVGLPLYETAQLLRAFAVPTGVVG